MSDRELDLHRQHSQGREKQVYFLLAAAGASIAFSLNQTREVALSVTQVPLGLAVMAWAISFLAGCLSLQLTQGVLIRNQDLIQVQKGTHRNLEHPSHAVFIEPLARKALEEANIRASRRQRLQFNALICGAAFYIFWHLIEMYLRR